MSIVAQKKDVSDPNVIQDFAHVVKDQIHLDYLYLLTVCDICATNPKLYNAWRASLLRQLYEATKQSLKNGNPTLAKNKQTQQAQESPPAEQLLKTHAQSAQTLIDLGFDQQQILSLWQKLGSHYFMRTLPTQITQNSRAILEHQAQHTIADDANTCYESRPMVQVSQIESPQHPQKQVFVYTKDRANLFAVTVSLLNNLNLSIQDAKIITSNHGFSLDTYVVLDPVQDEDPTHRNLDIETQLKDALHQLKSYEQIIESHSQSTKKQLPRQLKYFNVPTEVTISNDLYNPRSVVEIRALDQPGLLSLIANIFTEFNLIIENAKIATLGECAEDVFFVVDQQRNPLSDAALCKQLRNTIKDTIDQRGNIHA